MSIHYYCRHCQTHMASIYSAVDEDQLGFEQLSVEDRKEMIKGDSEGHIHVRTICENCEQALQEHPDYHERESFLQ